MADNVNNSYIAQTYTIILEALNSLASSASTTASKLNDLSYSCKDLNSKIAMFDKCLQEILFELKGYKNETQSSLSELNLRWDGHRSDISNTFNVVTGKVNELKKEMNNLRADTNKKVDDLSKQLTSTRRKETIYLYIIIALTIINGIQAGIKVFKFFIP